MKFELKKFNDLSIDELYSLLRLRVEIFVVEQNCPYQDLDNQDQCSFHLLVKDNKDIVGVLRIIPENISYKEIAIGRLVVKESHRGQGIAQKMMHKAMDFIINDLDKSKIRLSGQAYLIDFYQNLGFKRVSDEYLEDGIKHYEFLYENI